MKIAREAVQLCLGDRNYRVAIFTIEVDVANSEKIFEIYQYQEGLIYKTEKSDKEVVYLSMHWFDDGHILDSNVPNALNYFKEYYQNHVAEAIAITISKALLGKGVGGFYTELRGDEQRHIAELFDTSSHQ